MHKTKPPGWLQASRLTAYKIDAIEVLFICYYLFHNECASVCTISYDDRNTYSTLFHTYNIKPFPAAGQLVVEGC